MSKRPTEEDANVLPQLPDSLVSVGQGSRRMMISSGQMNFNVLCSH